MATQFGGFIPSQDTENAVHGLRRTKRFDNITNQNAQNGGKRSALGNITNQSHRIQPFRAAKTQSNGSGFIITKNPVQNDKIISSDLGFTIHCDEPKDSSPVQAPEPIRAPLQDLYCPEVIDITDSPMAVDESMTDVDAKPSLDTRRKSLEEVVQTVPEYSDDIYKYLREAEEKHRPKANYMKKQPDITDSMRSILVDWLIEVAEEYKLHRETLFLAVNYIDRFLSQMSVLRGKLQLVGAACMFTASKYEEIYPPDVGEFVYITDDTYTKRQVLRMEHLVLKVLSFDIAVPTINVFTDWYLKRLESSGKLSNLAMFLTELCIVDGTVFMKYLPSVVAAAAVSLANYTINQELWTKEIEELTKYTFADIQECLTDLHRAYLSVEAWQQKAAYEKYKAEEKYDAVSTIPCPAVLPLPMQ